MDESTKTHVLTFTQEQLEFWFMTKEDLANFMNVTVEVVEKHAEAGDIPYLTVDGDVKMFSLSASVHKAKHDLQQVVDKIEEDEEEKAIEENDKK